MPITNRWTIPDDYSPATSEWVHVMMCIPNTRKWRGLISGMISTLTRGRYWDETTGIISVAQNLGRTIFGSLTMDCNDDWSRIATALESLDDKTPELKTLEEILADMGESPIGDLADLITISAWLGEVFPNLIPRLPVATWLQWFTGWRRHRETMGQFTAMNASLRGLMLAETGETGVEIVDEVTDDIWASLDAIISTAGAVGDLLSGLTTLGELFRGILAGYESEEPDNEPSLRALVNVVLEQQGMTVTQTNTQTVNCGSGGGMAGCSGGALGTGFIPDETPTETVFDAPNYALENEGDYPPGFTDQTAYYEYKCKAANAMYLSLAETIFQLWDAKNAGLDGATMAVTIGLIETYLLGLTQFIFNTLGAVNEGFQRSLAGWIANNLAGKLFDGFAPEDLEIFNDIRTEFINDKENVVCTMFNALSVGQAKDEMMVLVDGYLATLSYPTATEIWARTILRDVITNHWLNLLFIEWPPFAEFSDPSAVDCSVCSDYYYLTGTCSTTHTSDNNSADGDGVHDGDEAGPYPYTSWECVLDTPITINAGMTIALWWRTVEGAYHNWWLFATIDGTEELIAQMSFQGTPGAWTENPIQAEHIGGSLQEVRFSSVDAGPGPTHIHAIDGLRSGGYIP